MDKSVVVIGAGITGLAAAVRLQQLGAKVTILEKDHQAGGRMNQIEQDGFKFDLGPTIVMMPEIYREVFEFCGVNPDDYITMHPLETMFSVNYSDGTRLNVSSRLEKTIQMIEKISETDAQGYVRYLSNIYQRYFVAKNSFIERSFRKPTDFYNPHILLEALKLKTFNSAHNDLAKYVKSEKIQQLLSFQTLYIGISPFNGPSIYNIIPLIESIYGVSYIQGGMYAMTQGLLRLFEERGGAIEYNISVDEIVLQDKQAVGVRVADDVRYFDDVINTADFPYAMECLLPDNFKQGKYRAKEAVKWDYSCSCYMHYFGVKGPKPEALEMHNILLSSDFNGNIDDIFAGRLSDDPSIYVYHPGKIDDSLAPKDHYGLYVLMPVSNEKDGANFNWQDPQLQQKMRTLAMQQVEKLVKIDNFAERIVCETIFHPKDFTQRFNAQFGATFGLKPTLLQSNYFRPQPKAATTEHLYFAGSSVHPGAGVPIVLTSAKLVVQEWEKDNISKDLLR